MNCILEDSIIDDYEFQEVKLVPGDKTRLKKMSADQIDEYLASEGFKPIRKPTGFVPYTRWTPQDLPDDCGEGPGSDEL